MQIVRLNTSVSLLVAKRIQRFLENMHTISIVLTVYLYRKLFVHSDAFNKYHLITSLSVNGKSRQDL